MNWYKTSLEIHNLEDRNLANAKIIYLEQISQYLDKATRIINQTQRGARGMVQSVMTDKRMSSYPRILEVLASAEVIALDNPTKFRNFCKEAIRQIVDRIGDLREERRKYTHERRPAKGWFTNNE